jgi:Glycosyltransferase family 87
MYQISKASIAKLLNFILVGLLILTLLGFARDLRNTSRHGGADLRNRIVGARLLIQGQDPYYYKWQPGDPETLRDPFDWPNIPVSRVTVPPSSLMLYAPFANLPYIPQRYLWLILQTFASFVSLWLLIGQPRRNIPSRNESSQLPRTVDNSIGGTSANENSLLQNKFLWMAGLLFIVNNMSWRMHVETGQIYVFYAFILTLSHWILSRKFKFNQEVAGLVMGLAITMRSPILIFVLPMFLFRQFKLLISTLLGSIVWLGISILLFGQQVWSNYFAAMNTISQLSRGELELAEPTVERVLPQQLEGMWFGYLDFSVIEQSSLPILLGKLGIYVSNNYLILAILLFLLIYTFLLLRSWYERHPHSTASSVDLMFISGSLMLLAVEFIAPVPRHSYNDIQYVIPLILIFKHANFKVLLNVILAFSLGTGFLMIDGTFGWLTTYSITLGEGVTMISLIAMSLTMLKRSPLPGSELFQSVDERSHPQRDR